MTDHPATISPNPGDTITTHPESVAARVRAFAGAFVNVCATCRAPLCGCRDDQWARSAEGNR